jgi:soluble lytic murein transglycosylase-like protein
MRRSLHLIGLCALTLPAWAGENIVLNTGFRLQAERHEVAGGTIRIFSSGGVTEMPAGLVASIETVENPGTPSGQMAVAKPEVAQGSGPEMVKNELVTLNPVELAKLAAQKYGLPGSFVAGVMHAESGFNTGAISPKGAIGLMQLMPATARDLGVDPTNPSANADAGARYLKDLLARYEDRPDQVLLALAAYNAGPVAVDRYHGVPPYRETHEYILRVLKAWNPQTIAK